MLGKREKRRGRTTRRTFFVCLLVLYLFCSISFQASANTFQFTTEESQSINGLKQQIEQNKENQRDIEEVLAQLDQDLDKATIRLQEIEKELSSTKNLHQKLDSQLEQEREKADKYTEIVKRRVQAIYESPEISYLDVLLGSESFTDFLTRFEAIQTIIEQDGQILEEYNQSQAKLRYLKLQTEGYYLQVDELRTEQQTLVQEVQQKMNERKSVLEQLKQKEANMVGVLRSQEQAALLRIRQLEEEARQASGIKELPAVVSGSGVLGWPTQTRRITSPFGYRIHPILKYRKFHDGIDIGEPQGSPIFAAADGVVTYAGYMNGYGNTVIIYHQNGLSTLYGHIRYGGILVQNGQKVKRGEKIAEVGSTGRSTGPHLHFTVTANGQDVDPMSYLH
ncbi:peptidoglycan DD-metalloendopeptidase family protein [Aneurinibacillus thermoaerophilus]|uniref:murein hydrolase activator EnvC family protein n=1 Tax=Aneurinibacillus thermoaerophilus TaxID=143495 RepID=UPI002E1D50CE|nr:peptidoglycan DD-metalloendopeptidase family protein [Aneurinibacillus thermoaerophilus]